MDKVFLTILRFFVINNSVDGVERGFLVLWNVSLVLRVIVVVFEHVRTEDRVSGVAFRDIQSEIAVFIDGCNLIWATPDGLQFLSKVLLKGSSLVHDEVSHLKRDVCIPALLYIFNLFVSEHDKIVLLYLMG